MAWQKSALSLSELQEAFVDVQQNLDAVLCWRKQLHLLWLEEHLR